MRVLFLDIDGVLNADCDFVKAGGGNKKNAPYLHTDSGIEYMGISQPRVARLARIVGETGAKIVLVSSWKPWYEDYVHGRPDDHIGKYLVNSLSRKKLRVFGTTQRYEGSCLDRVGGIIGWMDAWKASHPEDPIDGYAILDDDDFDYHEYGLGSHWVRTYFEGASGGLTDEGAGEAIKIILGDSNNPLEKQEDPA